MAEEKYKVHEKERLGKVANDLQRVLGAREVPKKASPPEGEESPKKPVSTP